MVTSFKLARYMTRFFRIKQWRPQRNKTSCLLCITETACKSILLCCLFHFIKYKQL